MAPRDVTKGCNGTFFVFVTQLEIQATNIFEGFCVDVVSCHIGGARRCR